ncbi:MAG: hypothetical protein RL328_373 [Acidobacteriota bacterium]
MLLFAILALGILTMWVPTRWALTAFELAILAGAVWQLLKNRLHFQPSIALLAAVIGWGGAQWLAGWSVDAFRTQEELLNWTVRLAAFAWALSLDGHTRHRLLTASVWLAAALAVLGMLTYFSSPPGTVFWTVDAGTGIATLGPFVYRNQFAAFMELLLPVALFQAFTHPRSSWLYALAAGLMAASVVAAGSRTGAALCAAQLLLIPLLFASRPSEENTRRKYTLGAVLAAVATLTLAVGWTRLAARFAEPNAYALRWDLSRSSWEMFLARPLTGWGLGAWSSVYPGFAHYDDGTFVNQAHNEWAQWAAEGGILLFLLMLAFAERLIRPAFRSIWGLGALAVLLHAFVDYPFEQRPQLAVFFFVFFGLVLSSGRTPKHT